MAIQKTLNLPRYGGLNVTDAYIKINKVDVRSAEDSEGNPVWRARAMIEIYADQAARESGASPIDNDVFEADFPANQNVNALVWAYNELKSRERYTGATDV